MAKPINSIAAAIAFASFAGLSALIATPGAIGIFHIAAGIHGAIALCMIARAVLIIRANRQPVRTYGQPASAKHIRVTVWSDRIRVAYYDHSGRKVTARAYPLHSYYRAVSQARAKGYRVI